MVCGDVTYRLLSNDLLLVGNCRASRLLHGEGVGVPGRLLGGLLLGRLEPRESEHFDERLWCW